MTETVLSFGLVSWSCWAPGLQHPKDWAAWLRGEAAPEREGAPELDMLKPLQRRRLNRIGRAVYHCITEASQQETPVATVFCSAHGEWTRTIGLLKSIASNEALSPNHFSLSVHNAISGLVSIFSDWRAPSYCIAAGHEGIGAAFLLADGVFRDLRGDGCVLVTLYDDEVPAPFTDRVSNPPPTGVAAALLLSKDDGTGRRLTASRIAVKGPPLEHWDQVRHLVALLSEGTGNLVFDSGHARWSWHLS